MKVKIFPNSYFNKLKWLKNSSSVIIVKKHCKVEVLHFNSSSRFLLFIERVLYKPDLIIFHKKIVSRKVYFAYLPINSESDFFENQKVITNAVALSKLYFRTLGMQKFLIEEKPKAKKKQRYFSFSILWKHFMDMMMWK